MKLLSPITDNITELLVKIIKFTRTRQKIIMQNINNMHKHSFVPGDLTVDDFSDLLHNAINEHIRSQRILFRDTENIKFGTSGSFEVKTVVDKYAQKLLGENRDEYLELQINKLFENSLNQRVARELLMQKQGMVSIFEQKTNR